MTKANSTSTNTISSLSNQTSSEYSPNIQRSKQRFWRRLRSFLSCGLIQEESSSSTISRSNSRTRMPANNGNRPGWHTIDKPTFQYTIPVRYQHLNLIGEGAFGVVVRATDTELNKSVAIKKMLRAFDTNLHAQRTYRELKLLAYLNHSDAQIVQLYNVFTPDQNLNEFQTLYFVFKDAGQDLDAAIRRRIPFEERHIRSIIYSILRALKYMHSAGVIHRDLKPQNIGIDKKSNITILDFGLARVASDGIQTGYVSTRWWRAPEIYVNWERYNEKLDIWSVGCIMAELILLQVIFRGNDHLDQLNKIFDVLGTPLPKIIDEICTPETCTYLKQLPPKEKKKYDVLFGFKYGDDPNKPISGVSSKGIDLLDRLLSFDHRIRPTAEEALAHPFFENLHDVLEEPTRERLIDEHADATYSTDKWKGMIWKMIEEFTPPSWINDQSDTEEQ